MKNSKRENRKVAVIASSPSQMFLWSLILLLAAMAAAADLV